jgi:chemotaxis protein CheY-P-specific phosphatase CheC
LRHDPKMERLNTTQLEIVQEVIEGALEKAATSMEAMLKIRIKSRDLEFGNGGLPELTEYEGLGRFKVHLVKVVFNGEISGAFFFIIKGHEVDLINRVCLPASVNTARSTQNTMMKHGFMLEIENMIAAMSLEEISDALGVQLMGEVPIIEVVRGEQVNEYLQKESHSLSTAFYAHAVLSGRVVDIAPYFVWMLDENFVSHVIKNS